MRSECSITTHAGTELEERGRVQLERLLRTYGVQRWLFTRAVRIQSFVNPHSHPVLTLNTRQVDNDDGCLGTFLHEQFHWYAASKREKVMRAIDELRGIYPTVPVGNPEGGRNEESSYLHLIICTLELDALCQLIGDERGRRQISDRRYYRWIYQQALHDSRAIRNVMERYELALP